jgi:hypothetical protein
MTRTKRTICLTEHSPQTPQPMRHELPKTDYLAELNKELAKRSTMVLDFDTHMVLVEEDWACGRAPEDVAMRIVEANHPRVTVYNIRLSEQAQFAAE